MEESRQRIHANNVDDQSVGTVSAQEPSKQSRLVTTESTDAGESISNEETLPALLRKPRTENSSFISSSGNALRKRKVYAHSCEELTKQPLSSVLTLNGDKESTAHLCIRLFLTLNCNGKKKELLNYSTINRTIRPVLICILSVN